MERTELSAPGVAESKAIRCWPGSSSMAKTGTACAVEAVIPAVAISAASADRAPLRTGKPPRYTAIATAPAARQQSQPRQPDRGECRRLGYRHDGDVRHQRPAVDLS